MGRRKIPEEVVRSLLAEKNWKPIEGWEYEGNATPIPGRCLVEGCGYEGPGPMYASLKQGQGACAPCSPVGGRPKVSEEVVRSLLAEKSWEPIEGWEYEGIRAPIPGRCLVCGHESTGPMLHGLKRGAGACKPCGIKRQKIPEEVVRALLAEKNWEPVEGWEYVNTTTPIPGRCLVCGHESTGPDVCGLKYKGQGACGACSPVGGPKIPEEAVRSLLTEKNWEPAEGWEYEGIATPIPGRCLVCGHESTGPRIHDLKYKGKGACRSCAEYGFNPAKPSYLYTFVFTDGSGVDFICYGITNNLGRRRYEYERHLAIRGFQSLHFEDGAEAARAEKLFHDIRKASDAPYPNSQVPGTKTESFPLSNFELCTVFNHHWIAADAVSNKKYSLHSANGELVKHHPIGAGVRDRADW